MCWAGGRTLALGGACVGDAGAGLGHNGGQWRVPVTSLAVHPWMDVPLGWPWWARPGPPLWSYEGPAALAPSAALGLGLPGAKYGAV